MCSVVVPVKTMERLKASEEISDLHDKSLVGKSKLVHKWANRKTCIGTNYTLQVGEWLNRGEALIYASDDIPTELNEEAAQVLSQKIDEHKAFFSDWNSVKEQASRIAPTLQVLRTYFFCD